MTLFLHLGHHLLHRLGQEALALAADGVLLGGLPGRGEVVHQRVHHVMVARLLEVGHDDVARIVLGVRTRLADQASRPQPQHLVLAGAGLEPQLLVMLELVLESLFALVERRHLSRSGWATSRRVIEHIPSGWKQPDKISLGVEAPGTMRFRSSGTARGSTLSKAALSAPAGLSPPRRRVPQCPPGRMRRHPPTK